MMALELSSGKALALRLDKGAILRVTHPGPTEIRCETGSVWLTERHETSDWVLCAGQVQTFPRARALVLSAARDASLRLCACARRSEGAQ